MNGANLKTKYNLLSSTPFSSTIFMHRPIFIGKIYLSDNWSSLIISRDFIRSLRVLWQLDLWDGNFSYPIIFIDNEEIGEEGKRIEIGTASQRQQKSQQASEGSFLPNQTKIAWLPDSQCIGRTQAWNS